MPRASKKKSLPFWWRKGTNCYYVQRGGRQVRLSPDLDEAWRLYHKLEAEWPPEPTQAPAPVVVNKTAPLVLELIDKFLDWVRASRSPRTFDSYKYLLDEFANGIPEDLAISELKPYHVTAIMVARSGQWSDLVNRPESLRSY
jgi:hypothetical protein